jgi:hypothetical protein
MLENIKQKFAAFKRHSYTPQEKADIAAAIILVGFVIAVFSHYILGFYFNLKYPFNTFLFFPDDKFTDFFALIKSNSLTSAYYPLLNVLILAFGCIHSQWISLFIFVSIFVIYFVWYVFYHLKQTKTFSFINFFVLTFLTFPFLLIIDRSNFETFVFIFLSLFVLFFTKKNYKLAIIFLAVATSMKLYPIVFIVMFLAIKKYREAALTLITSLVLTVTSLVIYPTPTSETLKIMINNQKYFTKAYAIGEKGVTVGLDMSNSLYNFIRYSTINLLHVPLNLEKFMYVYTIVVFLIFFLLSAYIILYEKKTWKQTLILVIVINLFPHISIDYKLIYFFIPLFLFFGDKEKNKYDLMYIVLLSLILIPKAFHILYYYDGILIDPMIMMILLGLVLLEGKNNIHKLKTRVIK